MHVERGHARVLVVEDDSIFRLPLCAVLTAAGFDVRSAASAEAAEDLLADEPVDVVLSDVGLPGMDGVTLASRHSGTPFVLMTGSLPLDPVTAAAPLPPAVRARLVKPLDVPHLLTVLHAAAPAAGARRQAVGS